MTISNYQKQLAAKHTHLQTLLTPFQIPDIEVFASAEQNFRMRAEFRIWHEQDQISYAMFQQGQKASSSSLIRLQNFPTASIAINKLMPVLLQKVAQNPILKNRWYQCEFLSTKSGEMLVTMIYHKKLDDAWQAAANNLQEELGIFIIGRSRGQKIVLSQDYVTELLNVDNHSFYYRQIEGSFTQPNAEICEKMLEWACGQVNGLKGDLLELYCGNGNFTLPLARYFKQVLATEISKTSVAAAQWNIQKNQVNNIKIARLSAEEFTQAYNEQRNFRRLEEQDINLNDYDFSTIFIDPPRAGVDWETLQLVAQFENIIYISCNPDTLHDNLTTLTNTHQIVKVALFDQFPFTHHIESGVFLKKK